MINRRRSDSYVNGINVKRLLDVVRAVIESYSTVELGGWHPQFSVRVDPHCVDP